MFVSLADPPPLAPQLEPLRASIGDANFAALAQPGLTTVRFHGYDIGRHAARLILSRLQDTSSETMCIDVGFEVIERGSTKFR